jgi:serine/threonine protein phosphatase 1
MRVLAIGDIHGCFRALTTLVEAAQITTDDVLVTLGDYVDRGPNSCAVLDWLIDRAKQGPLIALRGNHELMMLRARLDCIWREDWLAYGGDATLASYPSLANRATLDDVPGQHWDFLENGCRDWYETATHFFVHAGADPDLSLAEQSEHMLFWEQFHDPPPHRSGKVMICGHTAQQSGRPLSLGHAICIDTWVYGSGWLTCLDVASGHYWQANQHGESREDWLPDGFHEKAT